MVTNWSKMKAQKRGSKRQALHETIVSCSDILMIPLYVTDVRLDTEEKEEQTRGANSQELDEGTGTDTELSPYKTRLGCEGSEEFI